MTTKVTVDTHAGWPVSVTCIVGEPHLSTRIETEVVPPHTTKDFYIHSGMRISNIEKLSSIDEYIESLRKQIDSQKPANFVLTPISESGW